MSRKQAARGLESPSALPLAGLRIVLVDDNEDARELAAHLLRCSGAEVKDVATAGEAHALVVGTAPDILVSDIAMPSEDGHSLIRRIRALPGQLGLMPAVALTAFGEADDRRRAFEAGFDVHVSKAGATDGVVRAVCRVASARTSGVHRTLAPGSRASTDQDPEPGSRDE